MWHRRRDPELLVRVGLRGSPCESPQQCEHGLPTTPPLPFLRGRARRTRCAVATGLLKFEALELQRSAPEDALTIVARGKARKDEG